MENKEYYAEPEFNLLYKCFFSWRQRFTIKLPESLAGEHQYVQVNKELGTCKKYISQQWALCIQMTCVVLLRLVGSQAISNARSVFLLCAWICTEQGSERRGNDSSLMLSIYPWHTYAFTPRESSEKGKMKVRGDSPPSIYQKAFLVIKA